MLEEQNDFAYENMERGSNKSFKAEDREDGQEEFKERQSELFGSLNMQSLIQDPGRGSHISNEVSGSNSKERKVGTPSG